jgi:hypothetical protein
MKVSDLGVCVSYNRVLCLTTNLANTVCEFYKKQHFVCPPHLLKDVFTVKAVDSLDHNPSSASAKGSFHGTAISFMQHPTPQNITHHSTLTMTSNVGKKTTLLPEYYSTVDPVMLKSAEPSVPETVTNMASEGQLIVTAEDIAWLDFVESAVVNASNEGTENLTWSSFHRNKQPQNGIDIAVTSLLPLLRDSSISVPMIKHAMDVIKVAVNFLNHTQTLVMACDQPLYALVKIIQWKFPRPVWRV